MILLNTAIGAALALAATTSSNHPSPGAVAPAAAPSPSAGGWVSLFDGKTLDGWTEKGGRYDGDADWTVEDGAIVGREAEGARGGLLYTEGMYADYEFECDVKVTAPFDSGIDDSGIDVAGKGGAGVDRLRQRCAWRGCALNPRWQALQPPISRPA